MTRLKWPLVCLAWALQGAALFYVGTAVIYRSFFPDLARSLHELSGYFVPWILVITALQAIFLFPVRKPVVGVRGPAAASALAVAALCTSLLVVASALALYDQLWLRTGKDQPEVATMVVLGISLSGSWALGTWLLVTFVRRGQRERVLSRIAAVLFLGTIIELAAIIPIHVMVRRKTSCLCERGTYWSLVLCATVGAFVFGPAILIPLLARRRKRWYAARCEGCGFEMSAHKDADRCPECGVGWRAG